MCKRTEATATTTSHDDAHSEMHEEDPGAVG